ncbi:hypothetical protein DSO57_1013588, partial [Entomophthora muscae]
MGGSSGYWERQGRGNWVLGSKGNKMCCGHGARLRACASSLGQLLIGCWCRLQTHEANGCHFGTFIRAVIGIPLGAIISSVCSVSLHGPSSSVSACGGLIPEKCGRAVLQSIGLAARGDPGSGFDSCSWAWGSRGEELSILTYCCAIDVPEVNKLSALWLAVDQTAQDLAVLDSLLTTTEAL